MALFASNGPAKQDCSRQSKQRATETPGESKPLWRDSLEMPRSWSQGLRVYVQTLQNRSSQNFSPESFDVFLHVSSNLGFIPHSKSLNSVSQHKHSFLVPTQNHSYKMVLNPPNGLTVNAMSSDCRSTLACHESESCSSLSVSSMWCQVSYCLAINLFQVIWSSLDATKGGVCESRHCMTEQAITI